MSQGLKSVWKHIPSVLKIWALSQPNERRTRTGSVQLGEEPSILQVVPSGEIFASLGGQLAETQPSQAAALGVCKMPADISTCGRNGCEPHVWRPVVTVLTVCRLPHTLPKVSHTSYGNLSFSLLISYCIIDLPNCTVDENVGTSLSFKIIS